jgi:hypothetical protein
MVQFTRLHAKNEESLAFNRINMPHTVQTESIVTINRAKAGFIRIFILSTTLLYQFRRLCQAKKENKIWWLTKSPVLV